MALDDNKIVAADYVGKDISGLADKPTLTSTQLKAQFDSLTKDVVAPKINALIDGIMADDATDVKEVEDATAGNLAALDAEGQIADSGKKAADFEAAGAAAGAVTAHNASIAAHGGIPTRHTVYKSDGGSGWYKILSFPATGELVVRVEGFSASAYFEQRGHWQIIINRLADGIRADLIFATNGITPSSFDVRLDGSTIKVYFLAPQYTWYQILSETLYGGVALTTYNTAESPSGTAITVNFWDIATLGISGRPISPVAIEFPGGGGHGGYLDFHFDGSTADYTSRIIEDASGALRIIGSLNINNPLPVSSGGTGATDAGQARANLDITPSNIGAAAASHTHSLSALGIHTVSGTFTLDANYKYLDINATGFTTADIVLGWQRNDSGAAGGVYPINVYAYASGTLRVYFANAPSSMQYIPLKITYISV